MTENTQHNDDDLQALIRDTLAKREEAIEHWKRANDAFQEATAACRGLGLGGCSPEVTVRGSRQRDHELQQAAVEQIDSAVWSRVINQSGLWQDLDQQTKKKWQDELQWGRWPTPTLDTIQSKLGPLLYRRDDMRADTIRNAVWCLSEQSGGANAERFVEKMVGRYYGRDNHAKRYEAEVQANKLADLFRRYDGQPPKPSTDRLDFSKTNERGWLETDYFDVKIFSGGTTHYRFKRTDVVEKLNQVLDQRQRKHDQDALCRAVARGDTDECASLLSKGLDVNFACDRSEWRGPNLHVRVQSCLDCLNGKASLPLVQLLDQHGADWNAKLPDGTPVLHSLYERKVPVDVLAFVAGKVADPYVEIRRRDIESPSLLARAVRDGDPDRARVMLEVRDAKAEVLHVMKGGASEIWPYTSGRTGNLGEWALHGPDPMAMLTLLADHGVVTADISQWGASHVHYAARQDLPKALDGLLKTGISPDVKDKRGQSARDLINATSTDSNAGRAMHQALADYDRAQLLRVAQQHAIAPPIAQEAPKQVRRMRL